MPEFITIYFSEEEGDFLRELRAKAGAIPLSRYMKIQLRKILRVKDPAQGSR